MIPVSETHTQINKPVYAVFIKQSRPSILHTWVQLWADDGALCVDLMCTVSGLPVLADVAMSWNSGSISSTVSSSSSSSRGSRQCAAGRPGGSQLVGKNHDWSLSCCQLESLSSFLFIILVAEKGGTLQNNRLCTALLGAESMWHWSLVWNNFA